MSVDYWSVGMKCMRVRAGLGLVYIVYMSIFCICMGLGLGYVCI